MAQVGLRLRRRPQRRARRDAQPARRQGRQSGRDGEHRPARAAGLHHHHRGLHLVLRARQAVPRGSARAGHGGARPDRGGGRQPLRRPAQAAARLGALRGARVHAGDDGHRAEPRPQRPDGRGTRGGLGRRALRLGQLPPLHPDVRLGRARHRPPPLRGDHRERQARRGRDGGHGAHRPRLARRGGRLQGDGGGGARRALSAGPRRPALGRHRRRVRVLDEPARQHLPPPARHPRRLGHRGERAGHGVRQHGRGLRHRRLLHPRPVDGRERLLRRVPHQRPGRGRRGRHPHAAADERSARQAGRAQHGTRHARRPMPSW